MKKSIAVLLIIGLFVMLIMSSCGLQKTIDGVTYDTCGILNADIKKNPNIEYEVVVSNVILSVVLIETIVAPIYFFGFDIWQPIGKKGSYIPGQV
jgi:hypothetical protein